MCFIGPPSYNSILLFHKTENSNKYAYVAMSRQLSAVLLVSSYVYIPPYNDGQRCLYFFCGTERIRLHECEIQASAIGYSSGLYRTTTMNSICPTREPYQTLLHDEYRDVIWKIQGSFSIKRTKSFWNLQHFAKPA